MLRSTKKPNMKKIQQKTNDQLRTQGLGTDERTDKGITVYPSLCEWGYNQKKYFAYLLILLFIRMFAKHRYLFLPFNLPYLSCSLVIGVFSEVLDVDVGVAKLGLLQTGVDVSFPIGSSGLFRNCDGEKGKFLIGVPVGVTGSFLTSVGV